MVTAKMTILISAMIDKMGIELNAIEGKNNKEVGEKLLTILVKNLYKAAPEFYDLIAEFYGCSLAEAEKKDIVQTMKDIAGNSGLIGFFTSPAPSDTQES